jgi:prolyl 4-hydroxylase
VKDQQHEFEVQRGNNRLATLLFYLNDVEEGGNTVFPFNGNFDKPSLEIKFSQSEIQSACLQTSNALSVKPKKGTALLFYNMLPDGNLDVQSLHAGCPVEKGEKWIANLWFWEEQVPHMRRRKI